MITNYPKLILGFVLMVSVIGCAKTKSGLPPEIIYSEDQLKTYFGVGPYWVPSAAEVAEAKAAILAAIQTGATPWLPPKIKSTIGDYALTYYGMTKNGKKVVVINGDPDWRKAGHPLPPNTLSLGVTGTTFQAYYLVDQKRVVPVTGI